MTTKLWLTYEGVQLFQVSDGPAYTYVTHHVAIDADGSPRAYHPRDIGIDALANAGYPNKDWKSVLVADPDNPDHPYLQQNGPYKGYFLSKTSLEDPGLTDTDAYKYVDSEQVPYLVFPGAFYAIKGTGSMGDLAIVRNLDGTENSYAIVADGGPYKAPLGEMSIHLAHALGGTNPNPRTGAGAPTGRMQYMIFPGSRASPPWRRSLDNIRSSAEQLLREAGGWPVIPTGQ
jgi:hypothetical protein